MPQLLSLGESISGAARSASGSPEPIIANHKRIHECAKESQILLWTWKLLDEVPCYYYDHYLWDGSVLCRLMNVIRPGSISKILSPAEKFYEKRQNIQSFLHSLRKYGMDENVIFKMDDLLLLQNLPRVTACIFELGSLVKRDSKYTGTYHLGEIPYEPIDPRTKRRAGMPEGDDIHVSHVDIVMLKKMMHLEENKTVEELNSSKTLLCMS